MYLPYKKIPVVNDLWPANIFLFYNPFLNVLILLIYQKEKKLIIF